METAENSISVGVGSNWPLVSIFREQTRVMETAENSISVSVGKQLAVGINILRTTPWNRRAGADSAFRAHFRRRDWP
jgi:hypothetical protein